MSKTVSFDYKDITHTFCIKQFIDLLKRNNIYGVIYKYTFDHGNYIGQSKDFKERWKRHKYDVKKNSTNAVHNAMRKYPNVVPIIIDFAYSKKELDSLEIKYIKEYNSFRGNNKNGGYNLTKGGEGRSGPMSEEEKSRCKLVQQKRNIDRPDIAKNHSVYMKQLHKDEPERGHKHSENMTQKYVDEPELRTKMSNIKKTQNINNPDMKIQQSKIKLQMYIDKPVMKESARNKSLDQWENPESRKKLLDSKRKNNTRLFNVYKDGIHIHTFDYVPDCAMKLFGKPDGNIHKVLKGERSNCNGYVFKYVDEL